MNIMPATIEHNLSRAQLRQLERFADRVVGFGVNFAVCDPEGKAIWVKNAGRFDSTDDHLAQATFHVLTGTLQEGLPVSADPVVLQCPGNHTILATALGTSYAAGRPLAVAIIDLGDSSDASAYPATSAVDQTGVYPDRRLLTEMLHLLRENFQSTVEAERQIETLGTELAKVYEELVLLHKLSTNMKVTESDANFLQMACDSLTDVVPVEGIAVLLERGVNGEEKLALAAGSGIIDIDDRTAGILHSRLTDEINQGKEALLDSEVDSPFKYDWPNTIKNIIAVPFFGKEKVDSHLGHRAKTGHCIVGLMVAVNRVDKPDFDSADLKLFNTVTSECAVFIENGSLFNDLKELFIGSLRALTNSIDAKDQYTRGHSERVAIISKWLSEKLATQENLNEEQIQKIYLAGLLHDIGKIGVDESVLRKSGKLTPEERECIRKHPSIGAGILRGIRHMRDIIPGVLYHHERVDGQGYPDGLAAQDIPLTGKIVGLADSFDAMTSKRTYRDAMTVEQALTEIEKNIGTQFDEKVARVFLQSDVYELWDLIQGTFSEMYPGQISEYGTAAVGTLIR